MNQNDNTQLILALETAARHYRLTSNNYDLIMCAAKRIRELDTEICELHFLAGGTADNELLYEPYNPNQ